MLHNKSRGDKHNTTTSLQLYEVFLYLTRSFKNILIIILIASCIAILNSSRSQKILQSMIREIYNVISYPVHFVKQQYRHRLEKMFVEHFGYSPETLKHIKTIIIENDKLFDENEKLRALSNYSDSSDEQFQHLSARIIKRSDEYSTLNIGSEYGIEVGNVVTFGEDVVGRISRVEKSFAQVELLFSSKFRILSTLVNTHKNCIVVGAKDFKHLEVKYLNDEFQVVNGEHVITSGEDGVPYGLRIGRVLVKDEMISIVSDVDTTSLNIVSVLIKKDSNI